MSVELITVKRGLVLFWSVWFSLVSASNVADGLKALGLARKGWRFASGNLRLLESVTARYQVPRSLNGALFAGVVLWELIVTGLFWRASWHYCRGSRDRRPLDAAFAAGLGLWGPLLIADELFVAYESGTEAAHVRYFVAQLATLLSIELLPDRR